MFENYLSNINYRIISIKKWKIIQKIGQELFNYLKYGRRIKPSTKCINFFNLDRYRNTKIVVNIWSWGELKVNLYVLVLKLFNILLPICLNTNWPNNLFGIGNVCFDSR